MSCVNLSIMVPILFWKEIRNKLKKQDLQPITTSSMNETEKRYDCKIELISLNCKGMNNRSN
jgi:hypothetical protein